MNSLKSQKFAWITLLCLFIPYVKAQCCLPPVIGPVVGLCWDGTFPGPYCGYGKCNLFGCNCEGGCRGLVTSSTSTVSTDSGSASTSASTSVLTSISTSIPTPVTTLASTVVVPVPYSTVSSNYPDPSSIIYAFSAAQCLRVGCGAPYTSRAKRNLALAMAARKDAADFRHVDKEGTGNITLDRFLEHMNTPDNEKTLRTIFRMHDRNNDGVITVDEMRFE